MLFQRDKRHAGAVSFPSTAALAHWKSCKHKPENCWFSSCHLYSWHRAGEGQRGPVSHPALWLLTPTTSRCGPRCVFKGGVESTGDPATSSSHPPLRCSGLRYSNAKLMLFLLSHHSCSPQLWRGLEAHHDPSLALWPNCDISLHRSIRWLSFINAVVNVASHPPHSRELPWRAACAPAVQ